MGQKYKDSAKAAAEADRISRMAGQNLQQVLLSLRNCLHEVRKTKRMLGVDPDCICEKSIDREPKWKRRRRKLHEVASYVEVSLDYEFREYLDGIETSLVDTDGTLERYNCPEKVGDDNFLWCDCVCVHEKVDMDSALWCNTPQTILELVFARLPLHQIFQLRGLSKHWRASIVSPSFQNAFGTTTSRRFAIIAGMVAKRLWSFGNSERKWHVLPFEFLPIDCESPVAGDGGLLCCRRPTRPSDINQIRTFLRKQVEQDLQLYVCNPLTQAWRKLPLPSLVQEFDFVHLVTDKQTKQYTITVVNDLQQGKQHNSNTKAVVEVYSSSTNMWTVSNGIFHSTGTNLIYYKKYTPDEFVGIRAYDKATGYTSILFNVPEDIFFSESNGFYPLTEYRGQLYMLQTEAATSGIWVLRGPSHEWEKICSVPEPPEILKIYFFSLYVSADVIIISGDRRSWLSEEMPDKCIWMLDRAQGKWIDVLDRAHGTWVLELEDDMNPRFSSQFMFEIRFDGIP